MKMAVGAEQLRTPYFVIWDFAGKVAAQGDEQLCRDRLAELNGAEVEW